ncbi:MAG: dockerin type I repeat-containing protein, partial [Deltaproteobacteria bacterium]
MKIRYNKILIVVLLIATISFLSFRLSYANLKAFGDVTGNGITNSRDADYINFYLVGNYYDTPLGSTWQHLNGDVTGDDNVDTNDAALMRAFDFCLTNTYDNMPDSLEIVGANEWWGMGGSDIILTARALNMYDDPVGNAYMTFTVIEGNADFGNGRRSIYVKTISGLECFGCSQKKNFGKYSVTLYIGNTPGQRVRVRVSSSGIPCSSRGYGWGCFYCDSVPALTPVYFTAYTYGVNITSPP